MVKEDNNAILNKEQANTDIYKINLVASYSVLLSRGRPSLRIEHMNARQQWLAIHKEKPTVHVTSQMA